MKALPTLAFRAFAADCSAGEDSGYAPAKCSSFSGKAASFSGFLSENTVRLLPIGRDIFACDRAKVFASAGESFRVRRRKFSRPQAKSFASAGEKFRVRRRKVSPGRGEKFRIRRRKVSPAQNACYYGNNCRHNFIETKTAEAFNKVFATLILTVLFNTSKKSNYED